MKRVSFQITEQQEMRRAEADMEFARTCPNTLHLFPESVRRPLRNLVDGVCPRRSANRKLHASEFQVFAVKYIINTTERRGYIFVTKFGFTEFNVYVIF
jgi:hypothetical protein